MSPDLFDLNECLEQFQNVGEIIQGIRMNLSAIEGLLNPIRTGVKEFSIEYLDIVKDEREKYWKFLKWWRLPQLSEGEVSRLKRIFVKLEPQNKEVIEILYDIFKNIEIVSCLLRFVDPFDYGIFSPPVENLLNCQGNDAVSRYLNYLSDLEELKKTYRFWRIADVDMALWTLSNILNYSVLREYPKYEDIHTKYIQTTNPIKKIMARNSLEQTFHENDYLNLAELFLEQDIVISGMLAGRDLEERVNAICDYYGIYRGKKWEKKFISRLKQIFRRGAITREENDHIEAFWNLRCVLTHPDNLKRKIVTYADVKGMIEWIREFNEKRTLLGRKGEGGGRP